MLKGFIDPVILAVVARCGTYGYEIAKYVNGRTDGALELKEGTPYPALRRLEAEEFIEGYWGSETGGPRRRYYRITRSGLAALESARSNWRRDRQVIGLLLGEGVVLRKIRYSLI